MLVLCGISAGEVKAFVTSGARWVPRSGLAIVELLVVMTILVLLGAMGLGALGRFQAGAIRKTAEGQKAFLNSGIEQYLAIYGDLPGKEDLSGQVLCAALTGDGAGADGLPCTGDDRGLTGCLIGRDRRLS